MTDTTMKITLGNTIEVAGEEFVVLSIQQVWDASGRSVSLHAKDPLLADAHRAEIEQRRRVLARAERHLTEEHGD